MQFRPSFEKIAIFLGVIVESGPDKRDTWAARGRGRIDVDVAHIVAVMQMRGVFLSLRN